MVIVEKLRPEHTSSLFFPKNSQIFKRQKTSSRVNIRDVNFLRSIDAHLERKASKNLWSGSKSSNSSGNKEAKRETKSVRFSKGNDVVRKIPHLSTMSNSTIADYWFSSEDIEVMKWESHFLLYFEERGESDYIDLDSDSTRGLENMTEKGACQLLQNRRYAYNTVLNEQKRQRKEGIDDPFIIADLYRKCNKKFVDDAFQIAKEDENVAQEYLNR